MFRKAPKILNGRQDGITFWIPCHIQEFTGSGRSLWLIVNKKDILKKILEKRDIWLKKKTQKFDKNPLFEILTFLEHIWPMSESKTSKFGPVQHYLVL